tara:strand:+ start:290 stop:550 length:261 start_codon:yes stop_codon:yes gene_type:complete
LIETGFGFPLLCVLFVLKLHIGLRGIIYSGYARAQLIWIFPRGGRVGNSTFWFAGLKFGSAWRWLFFGYGFIVMCEREPIISNADY